MHPSPLHASKYLLKSVLTERVSALSILLTDFGLSFAKLKTESKIRVGNMRFFKNGTV
jgi:hypothetical protein